MIPARTVHRHLSRRRRRNLVPQYSEEVNELIAGCPVWPDVLLRDEPAACLVAIVLRGRSE